MTHHAPVRLLINPMAGRGRALRQLESARRALERVGPIDVVQTRAAGDETRLATDAVHDRVRALVVLGGDGTVSHVARALVQQASDIPLAILAAGSGNDFVKSLGTPARDYAAMATLIADGHVRRVDVGTIGEQQLFVNAAGFGFDVAVLERTTRARWLRGDALYVASALAELFRFRGVRARVHGPLPDIAQGVPDRHLLVVAANGQWFGGRFRIAPTAVLDDGALDLVVISDASAWRRARLFAAAPWGRHIGAPEVRTARAATVSIATAEPIGFESDGELCAPVSTTCEIRLLAGALTVIAERVR